jgi:hypothetical protein
MSGSIRCAGGEPTIGAYSADRFVHDRAMVMVPCARRCRGQKPYAGGWPVMPIPAAPWWWSWHSVPGMRDDGVRFGRARCAKVRNPWSSPLSAIGFPVNMVSRRLRFVLRAQALLALIASMSCGGAKPEPAPRSPTLDYPPPPPETASDGRVIGADGEPPEDTLNRGPTVGTTGVKPAGRPGETETEHGGDNLPPDPCEGGAPKDAAAEARCRARDSR